MTQMDIPAAVRPQHPWKLRPWKRRLAIVLGCLCVVAASVTIKYFWGTEEAGAAPQAAAQTAAAPQAAAPAAAPAPARAATAKIVATVNGEEISRQELASECLLHYGKEVLEKQKNKYLIVAECRTRGVSVTQEEVNAEIERYAKRFGLPVDQWLKLLKDERNITPAQYSSDIIWPMLALRKLAGEQLTVSREELQKEFETLYGPAVKARIIMCADKQRADQVRAMAASDPSKFGELAVKFSDDSASASVKGMIQPIRMHVLNPLIEQTAFGLKDGEVSQVLFVVNQHVILYREQLIPARQITLEQVQQQIELTIRDRKERDLAGRIFQDLEKNANYRTVLGDPQLQAQYPGVAAYINNTPFSMQELAERCIERYGEQVLEGLIHRRLLVQACKKRNIAITEADLNEEIARAAAATIGMKADGTPNVEEWIKRMTVDQGVTLETYRNEAVWPSVALKKLAGDKIEISEEDLQKGFEANYGPRVRCLAIILDNSRRAQEVWEQARQNPTPEFFGQLAEKYSIEASSRALRGEVPPIQKHGGQPKLEEEAFSLQPGQLSGIVAMGDKFAILLCLGHTEPRHVEFAAVKALIQEDIHEKKLRLSMAQYFQNLQDNSTIDNYLTGTSHSPQAAQVKEAVKPILPGRK